MTGHYSFEQPRKPWARRYAIALSLGVAVGFLVVAALLAATFWETDLCGGLASAVFAAIVAHVWPEK